MLQACRPFIRGIFRPARTDANQVKLINPATLQPLKYTVEEATSEDVDIAVVAAREALPEWQNKPAAFRRDVLISAAEALSKNSNEMAHLESQCMGKPISVARDDVADSIETLRYYAGMFP